MKMGIAALLAGCLAVAAAFAAPPVAEKAVGESPRIRLVSEAAVPGEFIRLDQVASADSALPEGKALSGVYLGRSPDAGAEKLLALSEIRRGLRRSGFDPDAVRWEGRDRHTRCASSRCVPRAFPQVAQRVRRPRRDRASTAECCTTPSGRTSSSAPWGPGRRGRRRSTHRTWFLRVRRPRREPVTDPALRT